MNREELLLKAKNIVNKDVVKGFSSEILKNAANKDLDSFSKFLKEISEQAWDPTTEENTINTYTKELVDICKALYPPNPDYKYSRDINENRLMDIAKKHSKGKSKENTEKVYDLLKSELIVGKKVEMEHTKDIKKAEKIAMDHLEEIPDYYTRLTKMEKDAKKEVTETKTFIKKLLKEYLVAEAKEHTDDEIVDFNEIDLQHEYNKLNDLLFNGQLQPVTMLWNKRKGAHGVVKGTRNRRTGKITLTSLSMSQFLKVPYKFFKDVLAHEMIHVFWMQQDVNAKHGHLFVREMNRINSMGLGFNVSIRSDSSETSKFEISSHAIKQGMELVFSLIQTDTSENLLSVMKYGTYKSEAYTIANIYKFLVSKKGKYRVAMGEFFLSTNPKLQGEKIQRSFRGGVSYVPLDRDVAEELKKDAKLLSKFEIINGEVEWMGPDKPNVPTLLQQYNKKT